MAFVTHVEIARDSRISCDLTSPLPGVPPSWIRISPVSLTKLTLLIQRRSYSPLAANLRREPPAAVRYDEYEYDVKSHVQSSTCATNATFVLAPAPGKL